MFWFQHTNNLRNDPKLRAIEKQLGEAGYARAIKLFEIVAERGGKADEFFPEFSLQNITDIDWLSQELGISRKKAEKTLEIFAEVGLIDAQALREQIVRIPLLEEYLDDWTKRRRRNKTPEQLRSDSGATTEELRLKSKSKEVEVESQRKEKALAAAAVLLKKKSETEWEPLGILPCGSTEFQEIWGTIWGKRSESEMTSDTMERCIQACKQYAVPVPKPFYDAKYKVESREFDQEVGPEIYDFPTHEVPDRP
jgi:hypothetical protein